jgi:uncharacterized repeat protein (TIGR01451 family)
VLADLGLVKSGQPTSTLTAGDWLTYTLAYTNHGPDEAINVVIHDPLDPRLIDVGVQTWASTPGSAPSAADCYTWTIPGVPAGGWGIITLTARVNPSVSGVFSLTNRATISTTHIGFLDRHLDDNTSVVHNRVDAQPPEITAVLPVSGAEDVAVTAAVVITFSESISADTYTYVVMPDPDGWTETWNSNGTAVTLDHDPFAYSRTYTISVTAANDLVGNRLSGAPYVWHFSTAPFRVYLPLVMRNAS